ncbi:hypothetical protein [Streptomyces sp. 8N706]|uniref:hypothetical protein n=1 Tax=Streptomyces sp. 8N706 TaxID=3457416 RepID=UPI003FD15DA2
MPTPYGSRGAMAFSADELRVLRRALALALQPASAPLGPGREGEVQELFRLAEAVDEAVREGGRLRAFLIADLARYRAALPGAAGGYVERLQDALSAGYIPGAEDLAALRGLCAAPAGPAAGAEGEGRRVLLHRCEVLAEQALRARLVRQAPARPAEDTVRLVALPGGRAAADEPSKPKPKPGPGPKPKSEPKSEPKAEPESEPKGEPRREPKGEPKAEPKPQRKPGPEKTPGEPSPAEPPGRPVPTPAEVFPPRRRPQGPPHHGLERLAAG